MGREPLGPPTGGPVAPDEPGGPAWPERVEDQIRNLKQLAAALGVLALIALGVAVWALLAGDDDESTSGGRVSAGQVSRIDDRVDRLEQQVDDIDTSQLEEDIEGKVDKGDVDELRQDVEELRSAVEDAGSNEDTTQAIDELSQRVDDLEQDVQDLQAGQP